VRKKWRSHGSTAFVSGKKGTELNHSVIWGIYTQVRIRPGSKFSAGETYGIRGGGWCWGVQGPEGAG